MEEVADPIIRGGKKWHHPFDLDVLGNDSRSRRKKTKTTTTNGEEVIKRDCLSTVINGKCTTASVEEVMIDINKYLLRRLAFY